MTPCYIAADLGGTNTRAARFSPDGELLAHARHPTVADQGAAMLFDCLRSAIGAVLPDNPADVRAIGVGSPGPLNPFTGIVLRTPNLPAWENYPLRDSLQRTFGRPVCIGNDANLAALGEWQFGAGQGHDDLIYLTISTGIGSGIISSGQLVQGHQGIGGELGHTTLLPDGPLCGCGQRGHLEALASGTAIARIARQRLQAGTPSVLHDTISDLDTLTARDVGDAARQGDPFALELVEQAGRYIGQALAGFLHIFNPSIVVMGGGVSRLGDLLFDPVRAAMRQYAISPEYWQQCQLAPAARHDDAGLYGALVLARQQYPAHAATGGQT